MRRQQISTALLFGMDEIKRERNRLQQARWREANRETARARVKAWALANPEKKRERDRRARLKKRAAKQPRPVPTAEELADAKVASDEKRRVAARARYVASSERDRERGRANSQAWRAANGDRARAGVRDWKQRNLDKVRADKRARKAAKRTTLISDMMELQRGRCAYCAVSLGKGFHVDHIMPLKRGGPDERSNLQLTCVACNLSKNARHPVEFAQSLGKLL